MSELGYRGGAVRLDHCCNLSTAEQLRAMIRAQYPNAEITIGETGGLCSFYAEKGGMILGFETT